MTVNGYAIKFNQLSHYDSMLISNMMDKMRKFALVLSRDFVMECKATLLNSDIDISRLVVYIQQKKNKKKNHVEVSER